MIILAPIGVVLPNSMMGEITPAIATAIADARGRKLLLPINQPHFEIVGIEWKALTKQISAAIASIRDEGSHFCPYLALGVRAAYVALRELGVEHNLGLEEIVATVETNGCFSDGIQMVTGCTFANNGLVFSDLSVGLQPAILVLDTYAFRCPGGRCKEVRTDDHPRQGSGAAHHARYGAG